MFSIVVSLSCGCVVVALLLVCCWFANVSQSLLPMVLLLLRYCGFGVGLVLFGCCVAAVYGCVAVVVLLLFCNGVAVLLSLCRWLAWVLLI